MLDAIYGGMPGPQGRPGELLRAASSSRRTTGQEHLPGRASTGRSSTTRSSTRTSRTSSRRCRSTTRRSTMLVKYLTWFTNAGPRHGRRDREAAERIRTVWASRSTDGTTAGRWSPASRPRARRMPRFRCRAAVPMSPLARREARLGAALHLALDRRLPRVHAAPDGATFVFTFRTSACARRPRCRSSGWTTTRRSPNDPQVWASLGVTLRFARSGCRSTSSSRSSSRSG